jgi:hypothetical protein
LPNANNGGVDYLVSRTLFSHERMTWILSLVETKFSHLEIVRTLCSRTLHIQEVWSCGIVSACVRGFWMREHLGRPVWSRRDGAVCEWLSIRLLPCSRGEKPGGCDGGRERDGALPGATRPLDALSQRLPTGPLLVANGLPHWLRLLCPQMAGLVPPDAPLFP